MARRAHRVRGIGLVEVLVALLIVSLAILGFLGLQVQALRQSGTAHLRLVAQQLANDLAERMRANSDPQAGLAAYRFEVTQAAQVQRDGTALRLNTPAPRCDQPADACPPAQLAAVDLFEWRTTVFAHLPAGAVIVAPRDTVSVPSTPRCGAPAPATPAAPAVRSCDAADIWVAWREPQGPNAAAGPGMRCPDTLNVPANSEWRCHHLRIRL
jgi:type IV pilus assembly protein PilV